MPSSSDVFNFWLAGILRVVYDVMPGNMIMKSAERWRILLLLYFDLSPAHSLSLVLLWLSFTMIPLLRPSILLTLRLPVVSSLRQPLASSARSFSSFRTSSSVLSTLHKQTSKPFSSTFFRSSRTLLTDSAPVVARPSPSEAWRRYAITAVRCLHLSKATLWLTFLGH